MADSTARYTLQNAFDRHRSKERDRFRMYGRCPFTTDGYQAVAAIRLAACHHALGLVHATSTVDLLRPEIQRGTCGCNKDVPQVRCIEFRIGIKWGNVIVEVAGGRDRPPVTAPSALRFLGCPR
jgi:hypothetical protein